MILAIQAVFLILKFTKVIKWNWWIVLIPLWIYLLILIVTSAMY